MNDANSSSQLSDDIQQSGGKNPRASPTKSNTSSTNVSKATLTRRIRVKYHNRIARTRARISSEIRKKYPEYTTDSDIRKVADEILKDYYNIQKEAQAEETKATLLGLPFTPVAAGFSPMTPKVIPFDDMTFIYPESSPTRRKQDGKPQSQSVKLPEFDIASEGILQKDNKQQSTPSRSKKRVLNTTTPSTELSENKKPPFVVKGEVVFDDGESRSKRRRIVRPRNIDTNLPQQEQEGAQKITSPLTSPSLTLKKQQLRPSKSSRRFPRISESDILPPPLPDISTQDVAAPPPTSESGNPSSSTFSNLRDTEPETLEQSTDEDNNNNNNTGLFESFFKFIRKFVGRS